jgi:hypothetical protein
MMSQRERGVEAAGGGNGTIRASRARRTAECQRRRGNQRSKEELRSSTAQRFRSTEVFFIAPVTWRLDREKPAPKHSDGFLNSSGKGVDHDHRLCESFDNGAEP